MIVNFIKNHNVILIGITFLFCLFCVENIFAQYDGTPQYAKRPSGNYQWSSSSDGITYIPVCWENPQGYSTEISWVKSAIANSWESVANVSFQWGGQCSSNSEGIRIHIADTRSHSLVGRDLNGRENGMELNFTWNVKDDDGSYMFGDCRLASRKEACIKATAAHEFGHALGFLDEDRDRCEHVTGRGYARPDSDPDSIMNYCNEEWNGGGKLSTIDIRDIQTLYGKIIYKQSYFDPQGLFSVSDSLAPTLGQVWENVVVDFGNSRQFFGVSGFAPSQTRTWNFSGGGVFCYKVWTYTMHANGGALGGYGEGCITLEKGGKYSFNLVNIGIAPQGYLVLKMQNTSNTNQVY